MLEVRHVPAIDREKLFQQGFADNQQTRATVVQRELVILRAPQRVQRHRNNPRLDRPEEAIGERRRVLQNQDDPLLGLQTTVSKGGSEPVDSLGDLPVGDPLGAAFDRD